MPETAAKWEFHPLTPDRWGDFEALFNPSRTCAGCWCMWFRLTRAEFERQSGEDKRLAMRAIVDSGRVPGILAYADGKVAGWCSVAPRADFGVLQRSRLLKPVDDRPVWSVVCFFIGKAYRGQGLIVRLLRAAVDYAATQGAEIVEGYPTAPREGKTDYASLYHGTVPAFLRAGFVEAARPSETRAIMRYVIRE
jgi:GNAT superfamily N-acetyltransferase